MLQIFFLKITQGFKKNPHYVKLDKLSIHYCSVIFRSKWTFEGITCTFMFSFEVFSEWPNWGILLDNRSDFENVRNNLYFFPFFSFCLYNFGLHTNYDVVAIDITFISQKQLKLSQNEHLPFSQLNVGSAKMTERHAFITQSPFDYLSLPVTFS